jgi:hypothetical protein
VTQDLKLVLPHWATNRLRWHLRCPPIVQQGLLTFAYNASAAWMKACGICLAPCTPEKCPDIYIGWRDLGPELAACSDMPTVAHTNPLSISLNSQVWIGRILTIDPLRVLTHEFGHVLGIGHGPKGSLMYYEYSEVATPQAWDIAEAVARYGPASGAR